MENPEILSTVTLQKAGWFNEEIFNKKTINNILFWALIQYFTDPQVLRQVKCQLCILQTKTQADVTSLVTNHSRSPIMVKNNTVSLIFQIHL